MYELPKADAVIFPIINGSMTLQTNRYLFPIYETHNTGKETLLGILDVTNVVHFSFFALLTVLYHTLFILFTIPLTLTRTLTKKKRPLPLPLTPYSEGVFLVTLFTKKKDPFLPLTRTPLGYE